MAKKSGGIGCAVSLYTSFLEQIAERLGIEIETQKLDSPLHAQYAIMTEISKRISEVKRDNESYRREIREIAERLGIEINYSTSLSYEKSQLSLIGDILIGISSNNHNIESLQREYSRDLNELKNQIRKLEQEVCWAQKENEDLRNSHRNK